MGIDTSELVLVADRPKVIEQAVGYGDWIPVVEVRRVIEKGKTVRMQLAIRGEEARAPRDLGPGESLLLELPVANWDVLPVVK